MLPTLLSELREPALFWLDGRYSAGFRARGTKDIPISTELDLILNHSVAEHVVLIDDARYFDRTGDYPPLDELLRVVRRNGQYRSEVTTDMIRLTPL